MKISLGDTLSWIPTISYTKNQDLCPCILGQLSECPWVFARVIMMDPIPSKEGVVHLKASKQEAQAAIVANHFY